MERTGVPRLGIKEEQIPVRSDAAFCGRDIPAVTRSEVRVSLTGDGRAAGSCTGSLRIASGEIGIAAFAIGDGVVWGRRFAIESSGRARRGQRFFFFEFGDFCGVGFGFRRFWRFFFVEAFCWIDGFAFGDNGLFRHRNSGAADQAHFRPAQIATNTTPLVVSKLDEGGDGNDDSHADVHDDGIDEELAEALVLLLRAPVRVERIGGKGGHL